MSILHFVSSYSTKNMHMQGNITWFIVILLHFSDKKAYQYHKAVAAACRDSKILHAVKVDKLEGFKDRERERGERRRYNKELYN